MKNGNSIPCKICFVEDGDTSSSRPENFLLVFSQESCGVFRVGWEVHILQSVGVWARADLPRLSTATERLPCRPRWTEVWRFPLCGHQLLYATVTDRLDITSNLREEAALLLASRSQCICLAVQQRHPRPGRSQAASLFLPLNNQGFLDLTLSYRVELGCWQLRG